MFKKLNQWAKLIKKDVMTLWFAYQNPECPIISKLLVGFIVLYALSPIDLIPDFIPILGYFDELIILPILIISSGIGVFMNHWIRILLTISKRALYILGFGLVTICYYHRAKTILISYCFE